MATKRQHRNALSTVTFNLIACRAKAFARGLDFQTQELFSVIYDENLSNETKADCEIWVTERKLYLDWYSPVSVIPQTLYHFCL